MRFYNNRLLLLFLAIPLLIFCLSLVVRGISTIQRPYPKDLQQPAIGESRLIENSIAIASEHEIIAHDPQNYSNTTVMYTFTSGDIRALKWSPDKKKLAFLRVYGYDQDNAKIIAELGIITKDTKTPTILFSVEALYPGEAERNYEFAWIDSSNILYKFDNTLKKFSLENHTSSVVINDEVNAFQIRNGQLFLLRNELIGSTERDGYRSFVEKVSMEDPLQTERIIESAEMHINDFMIAPNLQYAVYIADGSKRLIFHDLTNDRLKEAESVMPYGGKPIVSSDSRYIALLARRHFEPEYNYDELVILDARGEVIRHITREMLISMLGNVYKQEISFFVSAFAFSPDGNKLLVEVSLGENYAIMADITTDNIVLLPSSKISQAIAW